MDKRGAGVPAWAKWARGDSRKGYNGSRPINPPASERRIYGGGEGEGKGGEGEGDEVEKRIRVEVKGKGVKFKGKRKRGRGRKEGVRGVS